MISGSSNRPMKGTRRAIGVEAVEQMTPLEEARGNRVINRNRRAINFVEETWRESWTAESDRNSLRRKTAGSPQFKRARLEETLEDEQEKTGEDEIEQIGPENKLMTKSQGNPNHQQQVLFWTNVSMIAEYHFINYPRQMCPCTKKRNVFNGTSG